MSYITLFPNAPCSACWECKNAFVNGDRVFFHEKGDDHPTHLQCIKKMITIFTQKCPYCSKKINIEQMFTWKERAITMLKWTKRGAITGGIILPAVGILLNFPLENIFFGVYKGAIFGAFAGMGLYAEHLLLRRIFSRIF